MLLAFATMMLAADPAVQYVDCPTVLSEKRTQKSMQRESRTAPAKVRAPATVPKPAPKLPDEPLAVDVEAIETPDFVADLVGDTFEQIVDSSIDQMDAYSDMVASVAESTEQFREDNLEDEPAADGAQKPTIRCR